jgi:hypothetical protein
MYDYGLGGKDNFAVDREISRQIFDLIPVARHVGPENRAFLRRAVRFMAGAGIRQFLDLGSGLPTQGNVDQVAREVIPDAKVVYIDYDPVTIAHCRALLCGTDTAVAIQADIRNPKPILTHPEVRSLLDFSEPIGVLMMAILHAIDDDHDPAGIVHQFGAAVVPGSYLGISHFTSSGPPPEALDRVKDLFKTKQVRETITYRSREEILRFFDGWELVPPGLVPATDWRPDRLARPPTRMIFAGVGCKPEPEAAIGEIS